jgi:hypothetical protein
MTTPSISSVSSPSRWSALSLWRDSPSRNLSKNHTFGMTTLLPLHLENVKRGVLADRPKSGGGKTPPTGRQSNLCQCQLCSYPHQRHGLPYGLNICRMRFRGCRMIGHITDQRECETGGEASYGLKLASSSLSFVLDVVMLRRIVLSA